ncbi:MAG: RNA polymerase sigma factor [Microthrixaceae bacterium]
MADGYAESGRNDAVHGRSSVTSPALSGGASLSPGGGGGSDVLSMEVDDRSDEAVYAAHACELVRFATGLVGIDDAPDVVVDAFVRVAQSDVWGEARDRRSLWVRAVVFESRSFVRTAVRRRARERKVAVPAVASADLASHGDGDGEIATALDGLSAQQREVIVLTYWDDLAPASIAELLKVSEGTVRKQLARARARMKEALT